MSPIRVRRVSAVRQLASALVLILSALGAGPIGHAMRFDGEMDFQPLALQPDRGYFAQLPFENIDLINGNLLLRLPVVSLPGDAGMDLRIEWAYNRAGLSKWWFGIAGVPIYLSHPDGPFTPEEEGQPQPTFVGYDDAQHVMHVDPAQGGDIYLSSDFWRYTRSTRTLELPNGWVATYEQNTGYNVAMLVEVHDVFGNSITPSWNARPQYYYGPLTLAAVNQTVGGVARTLTFAYDGWRVTSMTFVNGVAGGGDRTWTFDYNIGQWGNWTLSDIHLPAGPGWHFEYGSNINSPTSLQVTTPAAGTVTYAFEWQMFPPDDFGGYVVRQRTTGGREIPGATWSFSYNDRSGIDCTSHVDFPDGRHLDVTNRGLTSLYVDQRWVMMSKVLRSDSEGELSRVEVGYTDLGFVGTFLRKVTSARTITQGGKQFTTNYTFHGISEHWADYHQPYQIVETGDLTRTTTRSFTYDFNPYKHGVVASQSVTVGSDTMTTSASYDASTGFMTSQTSAGVTTTFAPDARGNRASITDALNHTTTVTYDWGVGGTTQTPLYTISRTINPDGTVASETRNGHTTTFTYDTAGQQTVVTPPAGGATSRLYPNVLTDWVQWWRGNEHGVTYFDGFGRTNQTYSEPGIYTSTTYDVHGRKVYQSYPYTDTNIGDTFAYDGLNRVTTITHPDSTAIHYSYSGTDVTITDENGHTTTQHWVAFGSPSDVQLASVTDAAGNTWNYEYNGFGSLTRVDAPVGPDRTWTYDNHNWLTSDTQPESGTTTYGYDAIGRMTSKTDALSRTFAYGYDANNRLTSIDAPGSADDVTMGYDNSDSRTYVNTPSVLVSFTYDAANRLVQRLDDTGGRSFYTQYGYDDNDRLTAIAYPRSGGAGLYVNYDYDSGGRVTQVRGSYGVIFASQITYHPSGSVASLQFGNGETASWTYDIQYRPTHLVNGPLDATYAYDGAGNVTSITDARSDHSSLYAYDQLDRLTTVSGFGARSFTYDALGNRLTGNGATFSYDPTTQRLTTVSGSGPEAGTYSHDAAGNQVQDPTGTYTYTPSNLLRMASVGGSDTYYTYDGDGLRIRRDNADSSFRQYMIHDSAGKVLAEFDGILTETEAQWTRDSIYLGSMLIATRRPGSQAGIIEYAHTDSLGSVRATTDQSGAVLARHDYFAFGEDAGPGPATGPERQRFTGKERDSETFFDYFNARYYRNVIGRFTTIDPGQASASLDDPQGWNAYAYCRNNPLRFVDPDGRDYLVTTDQYDDKGKFIGIQYSWIDSDDEWEAALRNPGVPGIEYSEGDIRGGGIFGIFERGKAVGTFQHFDKMGRFAREITDKAGALEEPRTYVEFGALAVGGGAVGAVGARVATAVGDGLVAAARWVARNVRVDGPQGTRILQVRLGGRTMGRLDYGPIPGSKGRSVLHVHVPFGPGGMKTHWPIYPPGGPR